MISAADVITGRSSRRCSTVRGKATALAGILQDDALDRAVVINVPLEVARARLLARRVCTGCGRIYSVERAQGIETWTCGACGD
jgi:hypothetical protein